MIEDNVVVCEKRNLTAVITLSREGKLNAISTGMLRSLKEIFTKLRKDVEKDQIRCVVIRGAGNRAFAAGADIASMKELSAQGGKDYALLGQETFDLIDAFPCPVIASVQGFALGGGCELALACDFIVAADNAQFGQPEVKLGLMPGFGGTQRLSRRVGQANAIYMIASGETINAQDALRLGLVTIVVPHLDLENETFRVAGAITQMAPLAVRLSKRVIREGSDTTLSQGNSMELDGFGRCFGSEDAREGIGAFLEKRPAKFNAS